VSHALPGIAWFSTQYVGHISGLGSLGTATHSPLASLSSVAADAERAGDQRQRKFHVADGD